jgi:hypothetical protein
VKARAFRSVIYAAYPGPDCVSLAFQQNIGAQREPTTDKELFAAYLKTTANGDSDNVGHLYLSGFEFYSLDDVITEMVNGILSNDPEPISELDFAIQEFEGLVANLKRVRTGFVAYKAAAGEVA